LEIAMRILLFVSEYPPYGNTSAIHYFAREWVKMGNQVFVIYGCQRLIFPLYLLASQKDKRTLAGKIERYDFEGVHVLKLPLCRVIPKHRYISRLTRMRAINELKKALIEWKTFDVIVSHFCSNHLFLVDKAKKMLNCPVVSVFHNCDTQNDALAADILSISTVVGARSIKIENYLRNVLGYRGPVIQVTSGVPEAYIKDRCKQNSNNVFKFIYVGKLIKRKHVGEMLESFSCLPSEIQYHLDIIGEGLEKTALVKKCADLKIENNVSFLGSMSREEVAKRMSEADCFVMVSSGETFGLVYLEAMAAGCIVIASKGEGIDGVIVDGYNGFLVKPGDIKQLTEKIEEITTMSKDRWNTLLYNSHTTILQMTETKAATTYLNQIAEYLGS